MSKLALEQHRAGVEPFLHRMMVTPLISSPARIARWIGAAPRQRGSSEAWTLMQPALGASRIGLGRISP